jgi:hypothetical protein
LSGWVLFSKFKNVSFILLIVFSISGSLASGEQSKSLELKIGSSQYILEEPGSADPLRQNFENLDLDEKVSFYNNRANFLKMAGRALQMLKYGFGIGSLVKEKISFKIRSIQEDLQLSELSQLPQTIQADLLMARDRALQQRAVEEDEAIRLTLAQRSTQVISNVLRSIDRKIWNEAKVFSRSNEVGLLASVGIQAIGATASRGGIGGMFEIGISLGYNRETKTLAFQIYRSIENFKKTPMKLVFLAGIDGKLGFYVSNQKTGELTYNGHSFYPPLVPGYSSLTNGSFSTGFYNGISFPPSPLSDLFTFTNRLNQNILLRITVSPLVKSFIRVESGIGYGIIKFVLSSVSDFYKKLTGIKSCESVLL